MKRSTHISLQIMLSALVVMQGFACSAGGGSMGGTAATRPSPSKNSSNQVNNNTPMAPSASPVVIKPNTEGPSGTPIDPSNVSLPAPGPGPAPAPAQMPPMVNNMPKPEEEGVDIPVPISGAFLYCVKDKVDGATAVVLCAVEDKTTKKPIKIPEKYVTHKFAFVKPKALEVTVRELPATNYWHAEYVVKGKSAEEIKAGLAAVHYTFEGTDINEVTDRFKQELADPVRPNLTIQSLKAQTNAEFRCFDLFRMKGDKIVTTPCGSRDSAQDWFITFDGKISHSSGVCIKFNPVSSLTIEGDCALNDTPRFDIAGEQIKIRGTNQCVGLINPDLSGVDYVGVVACNTGDQTQHWRISPLILP